MTIRVRSQEGEVSFADMGEVEHALRLGLVEATDELLEPGSAEWREVGQRVAPPRPQWKDHYHWYVLAGILLVVMLLGTGWLVWLIVVSIVFSHTIWRLHLRPRERRPPSHRRLR